MNASALVSDPSGGERLALGRVSAGPLGGDEHQEMLDEIMLANRKKNPVKVFVDNIVMTFKLVYHTVNMCNPSRISPEMRAEKVRDRDERRETFLAMSENAKKMELTSEARSETTRSKATSFIARCSAPRFIARR